MKMTYQRALLLSQSSFLAAAVFVAGCGKKDASAPNSERVNKNGVSAAAISPQASEIISLVRDITARDDKMDQDGHARSEAEAKAGLADFLLRSGEILNFNTNGSLQELQVRLLDALVPHGYIALCDTAVRRVSGKAYLQIAICPIKTSEVARVGEFQFPGLTIQNVDQSTFSAARVIEFFPPAAGRIQPSVAEEIGDVVATSVGTNIAISARALDREVSDTPGLTRNEARRWALVNEYSDLVLNNAAKPNLRIREKGGDDVLLANGKTLTTKMLAEAYSDWCSLANTSGRVSVSLVRNAFFGEVQGNYAFSIQISRNAFRNFVADNGIKLPWRGDTPPNQSAFEYFVLSLNDKQSAFLHASLQQEFARQVGEFGPLLIR